MKRIFCGIGAALLMLVAGCGNNVNTDGCDNMPGCRLLVTGTPGRAVWTLQELPKPIRAGKTYLISACAVLGSGSLLYDRALTQSLLVRFLACNAAPDSLEYQWKTVPGRFVIVGQIRVAGDEWNTYAVARWTADADYKGLAFALVSDSLPYEPSALRVGKVTVDEE